MTYSLDLPAATIAAMRDQARDADISAARTFGFGGSTWDAHRPSGMGTGPRSLTPIGSVQALAFRQAPGNLMGAAGGTPILGDVWRLILFAGALHPGDTIVSRADPRYAFGVGTTEPWYDYRRCELERLRGDITLVGSGDILLDDSGQPLLDDT